MNTAQESLRRIALTEDAGARLDVVVGRRFSSISRRMARRLALEGKVHVDGVSHPPSTRVQEGQLLSICVSHGSRTVEGATILKITDRFVYAFKPEGVHTHRFRPDEPASLADFVKAMHPECASASEAAREGGAVHRLDFATSGLVAFARTREAWSHGRSLFSSGRVTKQYLAVCQLDPNASRPWPPPTPEGAYDAWLRPLISDPPQVNLAADAPLAKDLSHPTPTSPRIHIRAPLGGAEERSKVEVRLDGQRASTFVSMLASAPGAGLFHVEIETGLRHQIRAHLSWLGTPILGDDLYGAAGEDRLHLHSWRLQFLDEQSPEPAVTAPAPLDFVPLTFFSPDESHQPG